MIYYTKLTTLFPCYKESHWKNVEEIKKSIKAFRRFLCNKHTILDTPVLTLPEDIFIMLNETRVYGIDIQAGCELMLSTKVPAWTKGLPFITRQ